jgi:predicted glycosyltransferase
MKLRRLLERLWPAHRLLERAERRVKRLPLVELLDAADNTGSTIAAALYRHRKAPSEEAMTEAVDGVVALAVIVRELEDRQKA